MMKTDKKNESSDKKTISRRRFLSILGISAGATSISSMSMSSDEDDKIITKEKNINTYRETEHIKTVYTLSRF